MEVRWGSLLLLLGVLLVPMVTPVPSIDGMTQRCYALQRDVNIALLHGMSTRTETDSQLKCSHENSSPLRPITSTSFVYAIEQVNQRSDLLPNISVGFVLLDDCWSSLATLANVLHLLPDPGDPLYPRGRVITCGAGGWGRRFQVVGAVGPASSAGTVMAGGLSTLFHIPMVLSYASSDELSDKTRFAYTMRLVPPDRLQAEAMVDLVVHFGWTYVSLLYYEGPYGENGGKQLEKNTKKKGVCVAFRFMFPSDAGPADGAEAARKLARYRDARVVLAFIESKHLRLILPYLEEEHLVGHFIFIGGDSLPLNGGGGGRMAVLQDNGFSTFFQQKADKGFRRYFETLTPKNHPDDPFLRNAYQQKYNCEWNHTLGDRSCYRYESEPHNITGGLGWESKTIDGVNVYASALHTLISDTCPDAFSNKTLLRTCITGERLHQYMLRVEFDGLSGHVKFDDRGDFLGSYTFRQYSAGQGSQVVGQWDKLTSSLVIDTDSLRWYGKGGNSENNRVPESVCSHPCQPKEYYIQKELPCCWECRRCRDNEVVVGNRTGCAVCEVLTWPDPTTATVCQPIPPEQLNLDSPLTLSLVGMTSVGLACCLAMAAIFVKNAQSRLIKASSRQLMGIILLGITMAYSTVLLVPVKPSALSCYLSRFGFSLSVTLIYAPLMVKTNRIYRIFNAGRRGTKAPVLVGTTAQLVFVTAFIVLQLGLCVVSAILAPPEPLLRMPIPTERYVEVLCSLPLSGLVPPLSLNLLLILTCAVYGFLTRKLPENFNESWYIFVSVATTTFLWLVFLPAYFTAFYAAHQVALLASCLIFNGSVTLLCLYAPKIYCIYCVNQEELQFQTAGTVGTMSVAPATNTSQISKDN